MSSDKGRFIILLTTLIFALPALFIGCIPNTMAYSYLQDEEAQVLAVEDAYVAAEVNRDEAALRQLVDDKFQFNTSRGTTTGKEELIHGLLKMKMIAQTVRERSVLIEGNIALVFGTAEIRFAESTTTLRYTATYVKRRGQWRMLALQMQQRSPP